MYTDIHTLCIGESIHAYYIGKNTLVSWVDERVLPLGARLHLGGPHLGEVGR